MLSTSLEQTKKIAADFSASLKGGEVVALEGEIGAGKTSFVQGLAEALGAGGLARSPTFTVMNIYPTGREPIKQIVHVDAYRLRTPEDIFSLGLEEWAGRPDSVVLVEWPRMVGEAEIRADRTVRIFPGATPNERIIEIS
jgi:tRNA threonylcarbamoyladenosine biosynthesis protein TsaE